MSTTRPRCLVLDTLEADALDRLRRECDVNVLAGEALREVASEIGGYEAVVIRTSANLTGRLLEKATKLKVVGRAGVGLDNIDLEAARARGIRVVYTPESGTEAVADLTLGMMLCCLRQLHSSHSDVLAGRYREGRNRPPVSEMRELTLGIVGMGRIGRAVASRCRWGFGMRVIYHDIVEVGRLEFVAHPVDLVQLMVEADVVSLHVPLTDLTRRMMNQQTIQLMKQHAILINTSRGAVVDSIELGLALREGRLGGAALDVLDVEPPPPDHPLLTAPRVLLTPHIGARTRNAQRKMSDVVDDVIAVLAGREPKHEAR